MKDILVKILSGIVAFKPILRLLLKARKQKLIEAINKKYDRKDMTEEEEAVLIENLIDDFIEMM